MDSDEKILMRNIQEFCKYRDNFLQVIGLQDRLCSKMKRLSDSILDVLQIFTELTTLDIDLINREMSTKNFFPSEGSSQVIPYDAVNLACETWTKMHNLVEEIYYYFENKNLFKKIAKLYSSVAGNLSSVEDEVKSVFSECIYTILMRLDGSSPVCISYIFLWLKTAVKRELLDTGIGQCKVTDIVSFDEIDDENDKKRSLHEVIGYSVDFDSYIEDNNDDLDMYTPKVMKNMREKIFCEPNFYTKKFSTRKNKKKQHKEVAHV